MTGLPIAKVISKLRWQVAAAIAAAVLLAAGAAYATTSELSQEIQSGTITADILDQSRDTVANPAFGLPEQDFSFDCQTSTATNGFGTDTQRIYVTNPSDATGGWSLSVAATGGEGAEWTGDATSATMAYNDPSGSPAGCDNGQMTIDPGASGSALVADCETCSTSNISQGSSASFESGVVDDITLLTATGDADAVWRGYLTGATLSQTIPGETPADTFTMDLTLTVTAN